MRDRFDHTLEHKLESKPERAGDGSVVRRLELISGTGRRRQWSADEKARILLESLEAGANVSEVARRHGMSPQQLFGWRRQARAGAGQPHRGRGRPKRERDALQPAPDAPAFAPVVIASTSAPAPSSSSPLSSDAAGSFASIEIAIGDCIVRVLGQVETAFLIAVLRAVRRAS